MLACFKKKLKSEKGAMDKIIVTLLLVVIGVAAVVGLQDWVETQKDSVQNAATSQITNVIGN